MPPLAPRGSAIIPSFARWCRVVALCAPLAGCATVIPAPDPVLAPMPVSLTPRPGDLVRVKVWREPDLSADYPVDERGIVNLPLLGVTKVVDVSRDSLQARLIAAYAVTIKDPAITVAYIRRVAVTGAVRTPAMVPADATATIGDLIAGAGGVTVEGAAGIIQLVRDGRVVHANVMPTLYLGQVDMRPGDQLVIPTKRFSQYGTLLAIQVVSLISVITFSLIQLTR
jgi:polysaccharide export outer membrane protein